MALFLLFGETFPLFLVLVRFVTPSLADDLGYFGVGETGVLGYHVCLVVLAVEDECWGEMLVG